MLEQLKNYIIDVDANIKHNITDVDITAHAMLYYIEKMFILDLYKHLDYNQVRTARALGLNRSTLRKKLKEYGVLGTKTIDLSKE